MLVKLLSKDDKVHFLKLAELLSIADKPLLWDGKTKDEITARTDMTKVSIAKGEAESKLLSDWAKEYSSGSFNEQFGGIFSDLFGGKAVEKLLLDQLIDIPLHKNTEDSVARVTAVLTVLDSLLKNSSLASPHAVRIVLYELMLMALASGGMSHIELRFLKTFKQHHQVDDCDFDEILERAESVFREVQKTIALVLE